jgi:hypothetical protein
VRDAIEGLLEALSAAISGALGIGTSFPYPDNLDDYQWHGNDVPFLPNLEALYYRISDSRFQLAIEGSTGLQWVGGNLLLSEAKGAIGIQIDLLHPERPDLKVAVRISPLFMELAWFEPLPQSPLPYREMAPAPARAQLRDFALLGSALTLIFEKSFLGQNRAGIHLALRPGVELEATDESVALETAESIFLRVPLPKLGQTLLNLKSGQSFELEARISHLHRNESLLERIELANSQPGHEGVIPGRLFQDTWEGALFLTWKH